jgi:exonuclease SbcC
MKIDRLRLQNIRSYEDQTVEFPEGTILIRGDIGAGKTTLLMGLFGGLFQSNITSVGSNSFKLSDLVRRGTDRGSVELNFEIDGTTYAVEWEMPGEDASGASSATLTSSALAEPVSGITAVQEQVTNLLGMDEEDFSSSSYIRQGEVGRLIDAGDRAAMIDSLLGLDKIEDYIERAKMGRRGAKRLYRSNKNQRETQQGNLDEHDHDEAGYLDKIQRLNGAISDKQDEIEGFEGHLDELDDLLDDITDTIEEYDDHSGELAEKREQIEETEGDRADAQQSQRESKEVIEKRERKTTELREEIAEIDSEVEYDLSDAEAAADALEAVGEDLLAAQENKNIRENDYENAKSDLDDARGELGDVESELETARENLDEQAERIESAEATVDEHEQTLRERLDAHAETAAGFEIDTALTADDSEGTAEAGAEAEGERVVAADPEMAADALPALAQRTIPDRRDALGEKIAELTGDIAGFETTVESLDETIAELHDLEDAGECPKCGQDVEEAHVDEEIDAAERERDAAQATIAERRDQKETLEDHSAQLDSFREEVNETIAFRQGALADARADIEEAREEHASIRETIEEKENERAELAAAIEEQEATVEEREAAFEEARAAMEAVDEARSTIQRADRKYDSIDTHQNTIEQESQAIAHAEDTIESCNKRLRRLEDEREDLEDELGGFDSEEQLRERKAEFENQIHTYEEKRDNAQQQRDDLSAERTRIETQLDGLRSLQDKIDELEARERWADAVREDIESTLTIYKEVQSELRETYVAYINEYANDVFGDIYRNSSYQQIRVSETHDDTHDTYDYDIKLLRSDGTIEDPANASGGERAVVNLALRAGIYRLIAQVRGGDRSTLPPFILDEPTTFLDTDHVGQLEAMLETIKDWDVAQVIVVSHDESLIHGADHECRVSKGEGSTSQVEMRLAGENGDGSVADSGGDGDEGDVALSDGGGPSDREGVE